MSRYSLLVFSKSRPPNATLTKAGFAPEIPEDQPAKEVVPIPPEEEFVEEKIDPFPYVVVPLPVEWTP